MDSIARLWNTLPTALQDPVALAVPVFLVMLAVLIVRPSGLFGTVEVHRV